MRLTVPIVAALFIASTQAAPTAQEPTDSAEDAWNAAVTGLPPSQNPLTLFIQGLPQPCTDEELRGLWWDDIRSKITKITIPVHENGQNKDYARVEFDSDEDMQAALSSNAGFINGNSLFIRASRLAARTETSVTRGGGGRGGTVRGGSRGCSSDRGGAVRGCSSGRGGASG